MTLTSRGIQFVSSFTLVCVLAAAAVAVEPSNAPPAPDGSTGTVLADLSGRWEGRTYELARRGADCDGQPCTLTLDLVRCGEGWCGVEVTGAARTCGTTALTLDGGVAGKFGPFKGKLALAKGTEPYVVEAYLLSSSEGEAKAELEIAGDTGGEFRVFRRSFPFNATLARSGEALCRAESKVSSLD